MNRHEWYRLEMFIEILIKKANFRNNYEFSSTAIYSNVFHHQHHHRQVCTHCVSPNSMTAHVLSDVERVIDMTLPKREQNSFKSLVFSIVIGIFSILMRWISVNGSSFSIFGENFSFSKAQKEYHEQIYLEKDEKKSKSSTQRDSMDFFYSSNKLYGEQISYINGNLGVLRCVCMCDVQCSKIRMKLVGLTRTNVRWDVSKKRERKWSNTDSVSRKKLTSYIRIVLYQQNIVYCTSWLYPK